MLGICLKKENPALLLEMVDRNALALRFAALNCALNEVRAERIEGRLGTAGLPEKAYDLVLANLPAKAGRPVLQALIRGALACLKEGGALALVVVHPLAELVRDTLQESGAELLLQRRDQTHEACYARRGGRPEAPPAPREPAPGPPAPADPLAPYLRGRAVFPDAERGYELETVYNLPEFDTLGYDTRLAFRLLEALPVEALPPRGRLLVWNPGQGHVPVRLALRGMDGGRMTLAGRDLLQLWISERNLKSRGIEGPSLAHRALPSELEGPYSLLVAMPDVDPEVDWEKALVEAAADLLEEGGRLIVASSGTSIQRMEKARRPLRPVRAVRGHGRRGLLLQK